MLASTFARSRSNALLLLLLATFFAYVFTPIWDSDFWWHIASGRWIVEHASLPHSDPFGVFPNTDEIRNDTVLLGQWLGQVILYFSYIAGGEGGVAALRAGILTTCVGLLYWRARRLEASFSATLIVMIPAGLIALGFTGDRPQLFSYLFATLLFVCVEQFERSGRRGWLLALPATAIAWANMHGGYLLGVALLWLYVAALWVNDLLQRHPIDPQHHRLAAGAFAFTAASLLNPNGLTTLTYLITYEGTALEQATSEYRSAFRLHELGNTWPQLWVVLIYALVLLACLGLIRKDRPRLLIMLFLGAIAAWSYRYFAFLVFVAGPYICLGLDRGRLIPNYSERVHLYLGYGLATAAAFALIFGIVTDRALNPGVNRAMFPVEAIKALRTTGTVGKTFNHMQWGGYLLWHLYPSAHIYIDGRMLDRERFPPYTQILWATPLGIHLIEQEHFDTVMIPLINRFTEERYPLNDYLQHRGDWQLISMVDGGAIYSRNQSR